jgi:hypothetical protein
MGIVIPLTLLPQRNNPWQCPLFELISRVKKLTGDKGMTIQGAGVNHVLYL